MEENLLHYRYHRINVLLWCRGDGLSNSIYDPLIINAEIFKILLEMGLFDDSGKLVPLEREFLRLLHQRLYAHGCLEQKSEYYIVISA